MTSAHYTNERGDREYIVKQIGYGNVIDKFLVDRKHRDGKEIHELSDTGIVTVYNSTSKKMVTRLIATPRQIRRYYEAIGEVAPKKLLAIAAEHEWLFYNRQNKRKDKVNTMTNTMNEVSDHMMILAAALEMYGIPYEIHPDIFGGPQIWYPSKAEPVCDVICHQYSYGGKEGLLEIMGLVGDDIDDSVEGWLKAGEVFQRICRHYYHGAGEGRK